MAFLHFVCTVCGPRQEPCEHVHERFRKDDDKFLRAILLEIVNLNREIIRLLNRPQSATLKFTGVTMPATILVGGTANSLFQEWTGPSGTGTVVPNAGAIAYTSDNTAVATVDPSSGVATGVSAGTCNITGTDPTNSLTASDALTVTAPVVPAVSATLTLTAV
jgi:hypothetical protein